MKTKQSQKTTLNDRVMNKFGPLSSRKLKTEVEQTC